MATKNEKLNDELEKLVGGACYCQPSRYADDMFRIEGEFTIGTLEAVIALIKKEADGSEEKE